MCKETRAVKNGMFNLWIMTKNNVLINYGNELKMEYVQLLFRRPV